MAPPLDTWRALARRRACSHSLKVAKREAEVVSREVEMDAREHDIQHQLLQVTQRLQQVDDRQRSVQVDRTRLAERESQMVNWMKEMEVREALCEEMECDAAWSPPPGATAQVKSKKTIVTNNAFNESLVSVQLRMLKDSYLHNRHRQFNKTSYREVPVQAFWLGTPDPP